MKTLRQKLRAATLLQFGDDNLQNLVSLDGGMQPSVKEEERFDLSDHFRSNFIGNPERKNILLIGNSGAGKTWFGQNFVMTLLDENSFIPLWIRLTSIEQPWKNLIHQHLNKLKEYQIEKGVAKDDRLTDDDISEFFQTKPSLFLVLDGYDELSGEKREHSYYQENEWHRWGKLVQVLMTSRLEALPKVHAHAFTLAAHEPVTEYYIQPFDQAQLEEMVRRYCNSHTELANGWNAQCYLEQLTNLYELKEFISKPFLVKVVLDVLPLVFNEVASQPDETHALLKKRLTRYHLYKKFLEQHFFRESERLHRIGVGNRIVKNYNAQAVDETMTLPQLLEKFTYNLARDMFNHHVSTVRWHPAHLQKNPALISVSKSSSATEEHLAQEWLKPYFDDTLYPDVQHLRSGSPIVAIGFHEYAFLHYSILEFYAAEQLFNGALQDSWYLIGRNLNKENLQTTPDVLRALAGRIHEEPLLKKKLFEIIEQSKYVPEVWRAAANAITLLNCAGVSFSGRDFKRIRIGGLEKPNDENSGWGADLSHSVLSTADLSEADLRYVNLIQAHLVNTILTGACLDGVNFGERSRIEGNKFAFAKNGLSLVTQMDRGRLRIYSWPSRAVISEFGITGQLGFDYIRGVALHPTGQQVAVIHWRSFSSNYHQYKISLWDVNTQRCIRSFFEYTTGIKINCITYNPEGSRLAAGIDCEIQQWDVNTGAPLPGIKNLQGDVRCLAYSTDGSRLASGSDYSDPAVRQWDAATARPLSVCRGHTGAVSNVVYHPKRHRLASSSEDSTVREWDVRTGKLLQVYAGHKVGVACVAYHPDGDRLVSTGSQDKIVQEWDIITGAALRTYEWDLDWSHKKIIYSPEGDYLIFKENSDEGIRQYDLATATPLRVRDNHTYEIAGIAYSPDGARIASVGDYFSHRAVREWDVNTGNLLRKYELDKQVKSVTYSKNGRLAAGGDNTIWQWDITTGHCFPPYHVKNGANYIAYSPDDTRLASAGIHDVAAPVQQLDANTGSVFCSHTGLNQYVYGIAYSPDGTRLVSGSSDYKNSGLALREWSAITGESLRTYYTSDVSCVTYSHDGRLASGHYLAAQEWNITTGALLRTFKCNDGTIHDIQYSPNNRYLAFSDDAILHIVNVDKASSSKEWFKLKNTYCRQIGALAWSPDSTQLATGSNDHAVRLWRVCDATGKINPTLLWQTHSSLTSRGLTLHQATGLSDENYKLLVERSSDEPVKGNPADSKLLTSKKVLAERNSQIHLPEGEFVIFNALDRSANRHIVTPTRWLVSIMRKADQSSPHMHLFVAGITPEKFTIFREIHFYKEERQDSSVFLFYVSGKGLISIRHVVPYDLLKQLKENHYIAKSWSVEPEYVARLFENVERDSQRSLNYVNTGQTLFGEGYSCLTFCEKHLAEMDYDGSIGIAESLAENKPWYNFMIALPNMYLPSPVVKEPEPTTTAKCVIM